MDRVTLIHWTKWTVLQLQVLDPKKGWSQTHRDFSEEVGDVYTEVFITMEWDLQVTRNRFEGKIVKIKVITRSIYTSVK